MNSPEKQKKKAPGESAAATIGFRLDPTSREALDQRAELFEISSHALARFYVLNALLQDDSDQRALQADVTHLKKEMSKLRAEFAHAVHVMLVSAGKISPEQAERSVTENFNTD